MAIPSEQPKKKPKKSLLKTEKEAVEVQKMAVNIRRDLGDLGSVAEDFFKGYVADGLSARAAYKKMEKKMKNFTERDLQEYLGQ
jgi:hypothetical protein